MEKIALSISDLSCYSKSSLTVTLPVLENMGIETAVLPTALLSTQSDGFDDIYSKDLTKDAEKILEVWTDLDLSFDAIYSSYLSDYRQTKLVENIVERFRRKGGLFLVDPVLGDEGKLYQLLTEDHVSSMKELITFADIITPNFTEAKLLSNGDTVEDVAKNLSLMGPEKVCITSIPDNKGNLYNIALENNVIKEFHFKNVNASFPGSGDLFASLLLGFTLNGNDFFTSVEKATHISTDAIKTSFEKNREKRRGISLSEVLKNL